MLSSLSIIVPTFNEEKYLPRLLTSLRNQRMFPKQWEIIIVDGKSTDNTRKEARKFKKYFKHLIIVESKRGTSIQRNMGAQKAKYSYLFFVDADMRFPSSFFANFLDKIPMNTKKILVTTLIFPDSKNILDYVVQVMGYLTSIYVYLFDPFSAGGLTFTTKKAHAQIGGFNEKIIFGEDVDYGRRMRKIGVRFIFLFSVYTFHSPRRMYELGRLKFVYIWIKAYMYSVRHKYIEKNNLDYSYGEHR